MTAGRKNTGMMSRRGWFNWILLPVQPFVVRADLHNSVFSSKTTTQASTLMGSTSSLSVSILQRRSVVATPDKATLDQGWNYKLTRSILTNPQKTQIPCEADQNPLICYARILTKPKVRVLMPRHAIMVNTLFSCLSLKCIRVVLMRR